MKNLDMVLLLDCYGEFLTGHQRQVMSMYYEGDLSLAEVAQVTGVTRQAVRDSIKRAEGILTDMESKIHAAKKYSDMKKTLNAIFDEAAKLPESETKDNIETMVTKGLEEIES